MDLLCVMGKRRDRASQRASWLVLTSSMMPALIASDSSGRGLPVPIGSKRDRDLITELEPRGLEENSPDIRKKSPLPIFAGTSSDQELESLVDFLLTPQCCQGRSSRFRGRE